MLTSELLDKLRNLNAAHNGINNFYNEWPHAASLALSLPVSGVVPRAARPEWVKIITKCHIGNGHGYYGGVDTTADGHYKRYISGFGEAEVVQFLRLFGEPDFTVDFGEKKADRRLRLLAALLRDKTNNLHVQRAINVLLEQPTETLRNLAMVTKFKDAVSNLPKL